MVASIPSTVQKSKPCTYLYFRSTPTVDTQLLSILSQHQIAMGSQGHKLHIIFFPLMAPGHFLPMIDVAGAFAARGHTATIITTPGNASLPQQYSIGENPIRLSCIPFPPVDGLPAGCENLSSVPVDMHDRFFGALVRLRRPFEDALGRLRPDCVVSDTFFPWTADSAAGRGIPRLVLETSNFFVQCAIHSAVRHRPTEGLRHGSDTFVLPGLPHRVEMRKSMMLDVRKAPFFLEMFKMIEESGPKTLGTLVNTFCELEPEYAEYYRDVMGRRAWSIGPSFLLSTREREASADRDPCLKWLDARSPSSVVYVCFGSLGNVGAAQLREIAVGLELAGRPFVWVLREQGGEWMPEGFEERIGGEGLIVRGWAPQVPVLYHTAVGGFMTHCGWNSCLEGICAGLPLVTCPLSADQFYNERLVVDVLKVGVAAGMSVHAARAEDREVVSRTPSCNSLAPSMSTNPSIQDTSEMYRDSDDEIEEIEAMTSMSRKRSAVWKHFTIETKPDDSSRAICKYCKHILSYSSKSGTTHLGRHLKFSCKKMAHKDMKQLLLTKSPKGDDMRVFKFDQVVSRKCLAKLLICAELPFKIVEHPIFISFVRSLQPLFTTIGRQTIRNDCISLFQEEKQKLHNLLKDLDCSVSFTFDLWTSNQKLGYLALTAHYVDAEFLLKKKILNFRKVSFPHTSLALADVLGNCLVEWGLDAKLFAITADNCSANDASIRYFKRDFSQKLLFNGEHIHIRCCAHILNIIVQDGIKVMDESVKHVRNLIIHVVSSPSRMQTFNGIAQMLKFPTKKGLVLDVATRWNSTYEMLHNALLYKDAFVRYAEEHYRGIDAPTVDDWKKAETVETGLYWYKYSDAFGDEMCGKKVRELRDCLHKMYAQYDMVAKEKDPIGDVHMGGTSTRSNTSFSLGKRKSDMDFANFWSQNAMKMAKRNEVDSYLEAALLPPMSDVDFNILDWWKNNATLYPVLSKMARDVLAIPVSTVSSESAFSSGGRVVDQYRNRLSSATVEALICTQDWLRNENYIDESEASNSSLLDEEVPYECLAE